MNNYNASSLERYLTLRFGLLGLIIILLSGALLVTYGWTNWDVAVILGVIASALFILMRLTYNTIMASLQRGLLHIEAIRVEDFNQYAKSDFKHGSVAQFHQQLKELSLFLSSQKSRYDQHAFLVYQLIDQLKTPILVFNQKNKLSYANGAFSRLYGQPWQMYRHASPKLLGLVFHNNQWQLSNKEQHWQVSQSEFIDDGQTHQLLVFTNIESALRAGQQAAWQQLVRVMGHEIRNSLTPVSSLAESLSARAGNTRDRQALALISERCDHLQDFINRYSSLSQQVVLTPERVDIEQLSNRMRGLFSNDRTKHITLSIESSAQWLWADQTFLEQVLINLIKNANEADANTVKVHFSQNDKQSTIWVIDDGHGFANLDNLFVPLFTTKPAGQGIGLSFCRNIIEQHNGSIELSNNSEQGVTVTILLPLKIFNH